MADALLQALERRLEDLGVEEQVQVGREGLAG
jgi:hypothetical protein